MHNRIILYYGELTLKGSNRNIFVKKLRTNVRNKMKSFGVNWEVISVHEQMFIDIPTDYSGDVDSIVESLAETPGISWLSKVYWFSDKKYNIFTYKPDLSEIENLIEKLANDSFSKGKSFAIRVKRSDKRFVKSYRELEIQLANIVLTKTPWELVNLTKADQYFYVDITSRGIAVHTNRIKAVGGLPVSSSGRILCLLAGGLDSPLAAYLMAKRGCTVDFIHFTDGNIKSIALKDHKVVKIVQRLSQFCGKVRLFMVPYTHFDSAVMDLDLDHDLILFRRFMARVAEVLADSLHAQCLVTGDNLGQMASQTMENINSLTQSVQKPVFRPLLTYNKDEIVNLSREIGLLELSAEAYTNCCSLINNSSKTKSDHKKLTYSEERHLSNYDELINETLADKQVVTFHFGKRVDDV